MSWESSHNTKKSTLIGVGARIEEFIDGAEAACKEAKGAKNALKKHAEVLLSVVAGADKALESESEDGIPDLKTLALVKRWMGKMIISTQNASRNYQNLEMQAVGEAAGHKASHDLILKLINQEDERKKNIEKSIESGEVTVNDMGELEANPESRKRPSGVRPGKLKDQRQAMYPQESISSDSVGKTNSESDEVSVKEKADKKQESDSKKDKKKKS